MRWFHVIAVFIAAVVIGACTGQSRACTLIGAGPSVSVDAWAVAGGYDPADVLICVEDDCRSLVQSEAGGVVRFLVEGRGTRRDILVLTTAGLSLAGPTPVEFEEWYPNGEGCEPRVLRGRVVVDEAGEIR